MFFENLGIIKKVYSGLNQNDPESVLKIFDKNILRHEFQELPNGGTYRGHTELKDHLQNGRSTWAEGSCEPIEFFTEGNKIVVIVHVKVRLKNSNDWIDAKTTDGFLIKEGLVTEFHSFTSKEKAFAWAGIIT